MAKGHLLKKRESFLLTMESRVGIVEGMIEKVRGMRIASTINQLIRERGSKGLPLERVYRLLFNPELYLTACGKIYRNAGAMTPGSTEEMVDSMSLSKIHTIIEALRHERYRWEPARRVSIEKEHSIRKRRLDMPTWSDTLLQEVLRMILSAYYEPQFSNHSHGFRPERGCHTALKEIFHNWSGTIWFIEGDLSKCFEKLNHQLLLRILSKKIQDGRFLKLIHGLLEAGYLEDWKLNGTLSGSPQGGIISPILANIYLDKLDKYVEETLIPEYTRGEKKAVDAEYNELNCQACNLYKAGNLDGAKAVKKKAQQMPTRMVDDPNFRRLRYVRYADDFLLSYIGTEEEAETIKEQIRQFLQEDLKLELSEVKILTTHAGTQAASFLGYDISTVKKDTHRDKRNGWTIEGGITLRIPEYILKEKCQRYMRAGKAIHRGELLHESDFTLIALYQSEYRGMVEYYRLAHNLYSLNKLKWIMGQSLTKTLACKHKLTVTAVYRKYETIHMVNETPYKVLQVIIQKEGGDPLIARWGGIPLRRDIQAIYNDQPGRVA